MIGFILGVVVFCGGIFIFSYMQTTKRCRMFYYLETLGYALDFSKLTEPNEGMINQLNLTAKSLKLSSQPSISQEMDLYVQNNFNDDKKAFMDYARQQGFKG